MVATAGDTDAALLGAADTSGGAEHPDLAWARSGAMALTGPAGGTACLAPGPLASRAQSAVAALAELSGSEALRGLDGGALLGERAALAGLRRRGRTAPGGSCRLLRAADGWLALNLARADDVRALPAWLAVDELPPDADAWRWAAAQVAERSIDELVARARLLGLPAAPAAAPPESPPPWLRVPLRGERVQRRAGARPRVVDLSSLWAGPLAAHLLGLAGARVIKLESRARPDGARAGPAAFFDLLHAGHASVALDLARAGDRAALRRLVERADVVVESARPRALRQLGVDAEELVARAPGLVWLSLTGYGRCEPEAGWVAFGDDAAAAAGLAAATGGPDAPLFCGDAIADPLAGVHAALAAFAFWQRGEGALLDVALRDVAANALGAGIACERGEVRVRGDDCEVLAGGAYARVAAPRARQPSGRARPLGADTRAVAAELGITC
jgi:hypothetical protein